MKAAFVGPHPDDVELGAGGTIKKLSNSGWELFVVIVTKPIDPIIATNRKQEALVAASKLGVKNVEFLDFDDGNLQNIQSKTLQDSLYEIIKKVDPHLIFGPANIDQHNDHIAVNGALKLAAKTRGLLMYHVHHHVDRNNISRKVCIDITEFWKDKELACLEHKTEVDRGSITSERLSDIRKRSLVDKKIYEFFDIFSPSGYGDVQFNTYVNSINDTPFSRFWVDALNMITSDTTSLNFVAPTVSASGPTMESEGRTRLLSKLNNYFPSLLIEQINQDSYSEVVNLQNRFAHENCLFSGGSLANIWTLRFIHCYPCFVFRKNQFIRPLVLAGDSPAFSYNEYLNGASERELSPINNCGVVIVMWGWGRNNEEFPTTIYAAGASRRATLGSYLLLNEPTKNMCDSAMSARTHKAAGIQVNFKLKSFEKPRSVDDIKITHIDYLKHFEEVK